MKGEIVWHELYTSDVDAASRFYTELLGLELESANMGDFEYQMLRKRADARWLRPEGARGDPVALVPVRPGRGRRRNDRAGEVSGGGASSRAGRRRRRAAPRRPRRSAGHIGGLMQKPDELPVAAWGTYFATGDVDASAARAQELGAILTVPATSMENVGRYAVLTDPTGAAFGLYARES